MNEITRKTTFLPVKPDIYNFLPWKFHDQFGKGELSNLTVFIKCKEPKETTFLILI